MSPEWPQRGWPIGRGSFRGAAQRSDGCGVVGGAEDRRSGHEDVGAGAGGVADGLLRDAPVHLECDVEPALAAVAEALA